MKKFGLIGHPLSHSKSPLLHQLIASNLNRNITYEAFDIEKISDVEVLLQDLKMGKYHGFNITIPYKEAVIDYLDELTPIAKRIGAVNTVYLKEGKVIGDNTDYDGFKYIFEAALKTTKVKDIVILGSGGAAKACYTVCLDLGYNPVVVSRTPKESTYFKKMISYDGLKNLEYDLIIQTTPNGMYPKVDSSPVISKLVQDKVVLDLIYNPKETLLMTYSKYAIGGIDMLIIQALKAQNIWFNEDINLGTTKLERIRKDLYE